MTTLTDMINDLVDAILEVTGGPNTDEERKQIEDIKQQYLQEIVKRLIGYEIK